jgi:hypothetical protein
VRELSRQKHIPVCRKKRERIEELHQLSFLRKDKGDEKSELDHTSKAIKENKMCFYKYQGERRLWRGNKT